MTDRPLAIAYEPDHAGRMERALPSALQGRVIRALMHGIGRGVQALEDTGFALLDARTLGAASGVHLDRWGRLVGQPREGLTDAQYRRFIRVRLRVNRHARHGRRPPIDDLIDFARTATEAESVRYFGLYPAGFNLTIYRSTPLSSEEVGATVRLLRDAVPAAKNWTLTEATPGSWGAGVGEVGASPLARRLA